MASLLHPCPACGHRSMDECWSAGQRLLRQDRGICLDCHDECVPKSPAHPAGSGTPKRRTTERVDPRLFFAPQGH